LYLVINYEVPNHLEDYVHRCGRTGRAGNKGDAYTFITPEQDRYSADIIKALKQSNQEVPEKLQAIADGFQAKVKQGAAFAHGGGFGGKGLEQIDKGRELTKKAQKLAYGPVEGEEEEEDEEFKEKEHEPKSAFANQTPSQIIQQLQQSSASHFQPQTQNQNQNPTLTPPQIPVIQQNPNLVPQTTPFVQEPIQTQTIIPPKVLMDAAQNGNFIGFLSFSFLSLVPLF